MGCFSCRSCPWVISFGVVRTWEIRIWKNKSESCSTESRVPYEADHKNKETGVRLFAGTRSKCTWLWIRVYRECCVHINAKESSSCMTASRDARSPSILVRSWLTKWDWERHSNVSPSFGHCWYAYSTYQSWHRQEGGSWGTLCQPEALFGNSLANSHISRSGSRLTNSGFLAVTLKPSGKSQKLGCFS